jgi:hypothetical protein
MAHLRILTVLTAIVVLALRGQARVDAQTPTFKSGVAMVPLTVEATLGPRRPASAKATAARRSFSGDASLEDRRREADLQSSSRRRAP